MKKIIMILFAVTAISTAKAQDAPNTANTQDAPFQVGSNVISAGLGFGSAIGSLSYSSQTPVLQAHFEHGQWAIDGPGVISIGGYLGFMSNKYEQTFSSWYNNGVNVVPYQYTVSDKWTYTIIGFRSAYHYNGLETDKFDVYGGLMLSYNITSYSYTNNDPHNSNSYSGGSYSNSLYLTGFAGGRYFFSSNFAGYAELSYGVSFINLGVSFKL